MPRLDARWDNFWERGQTWYSFGSDGPGLTEFSASLNADAILLRTSADSFGASAYIGSPSSEVNGSFGLDAILGSPPLGGSFAVAYNWRTLTDPPNIPIAVKIYVAGVDISSHVKWATATFTAKVNGSLGGCYFEVIDRDHSLNFVFGEEIQLFIDGVLRWGGWVQRPTRSFPFPVMVVKNPETVTRTWAIEGIDYNAVFDKRIVHDLAKPDRVWDYPVGTHDDTVINDIWNYLDMTGFTKDISRVGEAVFDIPGVTGRSGKVASGGDSLRDVLTAIMRNTAGIFYVTPDKVVTYLDSDKINSPYSLSDKPYDAPNRVGYREMKVREDNSSMVNDALVWGAGYGTQKVVFSRHLDTPSKDAHGLWQAGNFVHGVYKQATANAISRSYVEGSPAAHRAPKKPKWSVEVVVWESVFSVGDVVDFQNSAFDLGDMPNPLPIRQMTITFPTPYAPRYALLLSWEIDAAWSFYDPWQPYATGNLPCEGCDGTLPPSTCDDPECGITDSFERVEAVGWGTSDAGTAWSRTPFGTGPYGTNSVNGSHAVLATDVSSWATMSLPNAPVWPMPLDLSLLDVYFSTEPDMGTGSSAELLLSFHNEPTACFLRIAASGDIELTYGSETDGGNLGMTLDNEHVNVRLVINDTNTVADLYVWLGSENPPTDPGP